ncbi:MAG: YggS family pyridoxal phosphate-dependent enzyme [Candidatus Makaraimicrobium thalassicum]|nr:MAG: YggS family pyridoxal phosphate-dependent enzyme [Candidatus Omnitrophota bacterium]
MSFGHIKQNVERILEEIPDDVELVAAAKTRTHEEIREAIEGGVKIIGENYVQEAMGAFAAIGRAAKWHFIGHLQKNKAKKAVEVFDIIETVSSADLAEEIDRRSRAAGKVMPVLIEINSGREPQKFGVFPEQAFELVEVIAGFSNVKLAGLMTMGPFSGDPEDARPYFVETRKIFEKIKAKGLPGVEMRYLSMGMTNSYMVAIEEGANIIRVGTKIFGERG